MFSTTRSHPWPGNTWRMPVLVATARYLHLKSQELYEALKEAHVTIGEEADERVRLREEIPAIDFNAADFNDAQAAADFNAERARLAEWDADQLRGQIGLVQQDLTRTRNDFTRSKASVARLRPAPTSRLQASPSYQLAYNSSLIALVHQPVPTPASLD